MKTKDSNFRDTPTYVEYIERISPLWAWITLVLVSMACGLLGAAVIAWWWSP